MQDCKKGNTIVPKGDKFNVWPRP